MGWLREVVSGKQPGKTIYYISPDRTTMLQSLPDTEKYIISNLQDDLSADNFVWTMKVIGLDLKSFAQPNYRVLMHGLHP